MDGSPARALLLRSCQPVESCYRRRGQLCRDRGADTASHQGRAAPGGPCVSALLPQVSGAIFLGRSTQKCAVATIRTARNSIWIQWAHMVFPSGSHWCTRLPLWCATCSIFQLQTSYTLQHLQHDLVVFLYLPPARWHQLYCMSHFRGRSC